MEMKAQVWGKPFSLLVASNKRSQWLKADETRHLEDLSKPGDAIGVLKSIAAFLRERGTFILQCPE